MDISGHIPVRGVMAKYTRGASCIHPAEAGGTCAEELTDCGLCEWRAGTPARYFVVSLFEAIKTGHRSAPWCAFITQWSINRRTGHHAEYHVQDG